jgi:hypothetical protein
VSPGREAGLRRQAGPTLFLNERAGSAVGFSPGSRPERAMASAANCSFPIPRAISKMQLSVSPRANSASASPSPALLVSIEGGDSSRFRYLQ